MPDRSGAVVGVGRRRPGRRGRRRGRRRLLRRNAVARPRGTVAAAPARGVGAPGRPGLRGGGLRHRDRVRRHAVARDSPTRRRRVGRRGRRVRAARPVRGRRRGAESCARTASGFERVDGKTRDALYALWGLGRRPRARGRRLRRHPALERAGVEQLSPPAPRRSFGFFTASPAALSATSWWSACREPRRTSTGRRWSRRVTGTTADLLGVASLDDTRWIAVGTRGTALVWDGEAWIEEDTGTDAGLRAVWVAPRRDGLGRRGRGHGAPAPAVRVPRRESGALAAGELHEYHRPSNCGVRVAEEESTVRAAARPRRLG